MLLASGFYSNQAGVTPDSTWSLNNCCLVLGCNENLLPHWLIAQKIRHTYSKMSSVMCGNMESLKHSKAWNILAFTYAKTHKI